MIIYFDQALLDTFPNTRKWDKRPRRWNACVVWEKEKEQKKRAYTKKRPPMFTHWPLNTCALCGKKLLNKGPHICYSTESEVIKQ